MATYYVDPAGSDSNNGTSPDTPWQTTAKVNGATYAAGDTILFKRGGVWATTTLGINSQAGTAANPLLVSAYGTGPLPRFNTPPGAGGYCFRRTTYGAADNYQVYRSLWLDGGVQCNSTQHIYFVACMFERYAFLIGNAVPNYVHLYNCLLSVGSPEIILGSKAVVVSTGTAGSILKIRNTLVLGPYSSSAPVGAIDEDYNFFAGTNEIPVAGTGTHSTYYAVDPKIVSSTFEQYLVPANMNRASFGLHFDGDYQDLTALASLRALCSRWGIKFSWFVVYRHAYTGQVSLPAHEQAMRDCLAEKHEIAIHSRNHCDLSLTSMFKITSTNTSPTISVDAASKTLTLDCSDPTKRVIVDWSAQEKLFSDLSAAVAGKGWALALSTAGYPSTSMKSWLPLHVLASTGGTVAIPAGGYAALLARTGAPGSNPWMDYEVGWMKDWLHSVTGVYPTTIAYPGGYNDAVVWEYCSALGLKGGRGVKYHGELRSDSSINLFRTYSLQYLLVQDATTGGLSERGREFALHCRYNAANSSAYCHEMLDMPTDAFVSAILAADGVFRTYNDHLDILRAQMESADGIHFTNKPAYAYATRLDGRMWGDQSPLLGTGLDLSSEPLGEIFSAGLSSANPPLGIGADTAEVARPLYVNGWSIGPFVPTTRIPDTIKPTVKAFVMPATSSSLTVPVTQFQAVDNFPVEELVYLVTQSGTVPDPLDVGWGSGIPTVASASAPGQVTFYAWAKDAAGNISDPLTQTVTITLPAQGVFYFDSTYGGGNSDGSSNHPYTSLSQAGVWANGNTFNIKRGSVFETCLTVAASNVTIQAYGTGALPVIKGSRTLVAADMTLVAGQQYVYRVSCTTEAGTTPKAVYIKRPPETEGKKAYRVPSAPRNVVGTTDATLGDREWYWEAGYLYLGCRNGSPASNGWVIDVPYYNYCLYLPQSATHYGNLTVVDVELQRANSYGAWIGDPVSTGNTINGCTIRQSYGGLKLSGQVTTINGARLSDLAFGLDLLTNSDTRINDTLFEKNYGYAIGIALNATNSRFAVNGCTFAGANIQNSCPSTVGTIKNAIFAGSPLAGDLPPVHNSATWTTGSITISHSLFSAAGQGVIGSNQVDQLWTTTAGKAITDGGNNRVGFADFKTLQPLHVAISNDEWEAGANYTGWHLALTEMVKSYGRANWTGISTVEYPSASFTAADWANMRTFINAGGEIIGHSLNHPNVSRTAALSVTYSGAGSGSVVISGNTLPDAGTGRLELVVDGTTVHTIVLGATVATGAAGYVNGVVPQIIAFGNGWTAAGIASEAMSHCYANGATAMNGSAVRIPLDIQRFLDYEIKGSKDRIEANIPGYTVRGFICPYGTFATDHNVGSYLRGYGFTNSRTITPVAYATPGLQYDLAGYYRYEYDTPESRDLYALKSQAESNFFHVAGLIAHYNGAVLPTKDSSLNLYDCDNGSSNATLTASAPLAARHRGQHVISCNGTTQYLARAAGWPKATYRDDAGNGDWQWGAYVYPVGLPAAGTRGTLLFHGVDANYHQLYLTPEGYVCYELVVNGAPLVQLTSAKNNIAVTPNTDGYSIMVRQAFGRIDLFVNTGKWSRVVADTINTTTIAPTVTGRVQLGATYLGGVVADYYQGYLDDVQICCKTVQLTRGAIEAAGIMGSPVIMYNHTSPPHDVFKTILDSLYYYRSSDIRVQPISDLVDYWKTLPGAELSTPGIAEQGQRLSYNYQAVNDYTPLAGSMADVAGDGRAYLGAFAPNSDVTPPVITSFTVVQPNPGTTEVSFNLAAEDLPGPEVNTSGMVGGRSGYYIHGDTVDTLTAPPAGSEELFVQTVGDHFTLSPVKMYTGFSGTGTRYLYAWARDLAGNVSAPAVRTVALTVSSKQQPVIVWATPSAITYGTVLSSAQLNASVNVQGVFAYSPGIGTILDVGNGYYTLAVTFTPEDTVTYDTVTKTVTIAVTKAQAGLSLTGMTQTYDGNPKQPTVTTVPAGLTVDMTYNGSGVVPSAIGSYPVVATVVDGNYQGSVTGTFVITAQKTTPTISWATPADVVVGTALSGAQLNATATAAGSFVYTPGAGTVLTTIGPQTLTTTFTPDNTTLYNPATASVTLQVTGQQQPVIVWATPSAITYGTVLSGTQLNASASVPGAFSYTPPVGAVLDAGLHQLQATFTPTDTLTYATTTASVSLVVNKAPATIALGSLTQEYTGAPRPVTITTQPAGLPVTVTYAGSLSAPTEAGSYPVVATIVDPNYVGSANGTLTVTAPVAQPTLSSMTPNSIAQGEHVTLALAGTNLTGALVSINGVGVVITSTTVIGESLISLEVTAAASAYPGNRIISVTVNSVVVTTTLQVTEVLPTTTTHAVSLKYWAGRGSISARVRDVGGRFFNAATEVWAAAEELGVRQPLAEHPDNDPVESRYSGTVVIPASGGPYIVECYYNDEYLGEEWTSFNSTINTSDIAYSVLSAFPEGYTLGTVGGLLNKLNVPAGTGNPVAVVPVSTNPGICTVAVDLVDLGFNPEPGIAVMVRAAAAVGMSATVVDNRKLTHPTDVNGRSLIPVIKGLTVQVYVPPVGRWVDVDTTDKDIVYFADLI